MNSASIMNNVEFYNVGSVESIPGLGEQCLVRLPRVIREKLNHQARLMAMQSTGCEIRMVSEAPAIDVYLSALNTDPDTTPELRIFRGDFLHQTCLLEPGRTIGIRLTPPPALGEVRQIRLNSGGFSDQVWRLVMNNGMMLSLHNIDTHGLPLRPPTPQEKPQFNWLAYGSSITHSSLDGYPHIAARLLKAQVQNKGLSGACHLEPALIDWLIDECNWDLLTVEMGINMIGGFTPEEFEKRARYAVERFATAGKPVLVTNLFPNCRSAGFTIDETRQDHRREEAFNRTVSRLVEEFKAPDIHFIPGSSILDDFTGLSSDLLHPCAYGHGVMAHNLARILKNILNCKQNNG